MKSKYSLFLRRKLLVIVALILGASYLNAQNLLTNGDFESGGSGVGFFVHDYTLINPLTGASSPGNYARTTNPTLMNSSYITGGDHTTGTGNMLVIDGSTLQNRFFWTTGNTGGAIGGFTAGTTYTFSYWIKSVSNSVTAVASTRANIGVFFVNAASINPTTTSNLAPLPADGWQRVSYSFVATANNAMVRLQTLNSGTVGCDFAVDDFSITQGGLPLTGSYATVNPTCPTSTNGSITVTLSGGEFPYGTYNLTGSATQSNTTGIFTGLGSGTYNVSVFDFAGNEYNATNIVLSIPNDLQLTAPTTTLCGTAPIPITASGGDGSYTWTANPPDSSITNPNAATQNVAPSVTTTYTVTSGSVSSPANLVVNGDFTQGNVGFTTGYTAVANPNPFGVQSSYFIVTNPNAWFNAFSGCGDHTTGTGNMMVFDGATNSTTSVWCNGTPITVQPNKSYTFSYYVATVAAGSPARLEVLINGVSLSAPVSASTSTCLWTLVSHTWNSGANTTANICIYNRETSSGGNDFAIDDLSLVETVTCLYQKDITITVGSTVSPSVSCGTVTANSIDFVWNTVPGATGYTVSYAINGGTPVNAGSISGTNYTVTSLSSTDNVTITVLPTGTGCFSASTQTCSVVQNCPTPVATVTQQPTCAVPTGIIVFTPPTVQPLPTDLFISEVTDHSTGSLSYVEIFNGTGTPKNLANYKIAVYNNGNTFISPNCEITLSGTLNNNDVFVLAIGSNTNQGGVIPDMVRATCGAVNTDDNIRLTSSSNALIDTWGRNDGVAFTPGNAAGYTYRRLDTVVAPSTVWNPADWTALDPEDYTDVGSYTFTPPTGVFEYSIDGTNYQSSPTFTGVAPGTYYGTIRDIVTGCISSSITLIVNPLPVVPAPTVAPVSYCQNVTAIPLTATPSTGGTLNWYGTNPTGGTASATAPTPSTISTGTTTYYVSQTVGGCESPRAAISVVISSSVTPIFTQLGPFCEGQTVPSLPSTSSNSVTGTWSPSTIDNTTTTTYTFTPNTSQCELSTTMTIVIDVNPTLVITNPPAVCSPATVDLTAASVTAGSSTGTLTYWQDLAGTVVLNNPSAITIGGTYYIKLANGNCFNIQPVVVTVNPNPTLVITNPSAVCSPVTVDLTAASVTAGSSPGTLTYWTNSAGTIVLNNPTAIATDGIYYIRLTNGSCSTIQQVQVTINSSPTLVITNPPAVCSPATVDLTVASVTAGSSAGTLTYWTNSAGTTVLNNPNAITADGTYYIKLTNGICSTIQPVVVTVNPNPTLVITNPSTVCSPVTVDLTVASVTAGSSTGTLTYWQDSAGTVVLNNPNAVDTDGTYYIRLTNGSCSTIQPVEVTIIPEPVVAIDIIENCSGNQVVVTSPLGNEFVYSLDGSTPQISPVFNNLSAGNHTIVAIQTFGNCTSAPFNFVVNPFVNDVVVNPNPLPLELCDPNNDGFSVFDLTSAISSIIGSNTYTVTYHETETDAIIDGTIIPSPTSYPNINPWNQTIYIRVESATSGCFEVVELQLIVNPTPEATEPTDYHLCDYTGAVGYESFNLTTKIAEILGSINAATHTVTFYTDFTQAQQGVGNITNVTAYTNGTINQETLYVRVENNTTRCYDIVTLDLIVDPLPNSTQPSYPQYSLCDLDQSNIGYEIFDLASKVEEVLLGQTGMSVTFYPSLTDAQNNTSAITTPTYQNTTIYVQTLGIRITNNATGCYVISTMDIRVEPLPEPIPPTTPYIICDDNQDGFADFDLSTLITDILGGENYIITFHETEDNAITNDNALSTTNYTNINPFVQILYVRAEDPDTGCFSVMPITLEVNPSPVAPINLDNIEVCDTNANNQNGIMTVDLTIRTPDALAQQPLPASNYTVEYYTTEALAEDGDFPIINTTNYSASNGQTIWVRVENNATGCYNLGTFQVIVGIPLVVPTPQPINECDTLPNDQFAVFDLTVRQITALSGYTFQYYPSLSNAQNDINQITNITSYTNVSPAVQTLGVRIISAQGCVGYTTLNIRVLPAPEPNTNPDVLPAVCENATNSGQAIVDLTQNEAYILNGDTNLTLQYYPTLTDLENNTNEITNPSAALVGDTTLTNDPINLVQYVYIAVSGNNTIDHTGRNCYTVVPQGYIINPLPTVDIVGTNNVYQICESDPTGNDNTEVFDLTSQIPDLLEGNQTTPVSTYSVAFYETTTGSPIANPSAYTNTSNPQTIYVVITNTTTGCQSAIGNFDLQVNPKPIVATQLADFASCDDIDGVNDGQTLYFGNPLSDYIDDVLGAGQSPTDYTVTFYYNSQTDAEAGLNPIQDLANYQVQTGTYWVRIENNLTGCYITDSFDVIVEQLAEPNIVASTNIACVDFGETTVNNTLILDSQVTGNYTFEWYADGNLIAGETGSTLTVTEVTQAQVVFSVIAISNSALQCASDTTPDRTRFTVIRSGLASNVTYTVTNAFSEQQIITVTNDGYGIYHYSLDDGPILDNGGIFTNVPLGPHTVHVWDMRDPNGFSCGVVSITGVQIIDYPHYFTPNGDGYHDTWNIKGLENFADATKIYIFDRYGKLLKQISSKSDGWDGTFNGQLMPSTDYWFKVEYPEAGVMKEFKAHFSLKR